MIRPFMIAGAALALAAAVQAQQGAAPAPALSAADETAAFKAAGFKQHGKAWVSCEEDPPTASYTPGTIEQLGDFNGDGRPDAVITEGSSFCYGEDGSAFSVVSKQADGSWKLIAQDSGIATFLKTKGTGGWPDIEVGGPGFCFAVERWNGKEYAVNRWEYEGKACRRPA